MPALYCIAVRNNNSKITKSYEMVDHTLPYLQHRPENRIEYRDDNSKLNTKPCWSYANLPFQICAQTNTLTQKSRRCHSLETNTDTNKLPTGT